MRRQPDKNSKDSIVGTIRASIIVVASMIVGGFSGFGMSLNTHKIDSNIEYLKQYEWFAEIYKEEKYRKLFFIRYKVRSYLNSTIRTRLTVKSTKQQKKFLDLLESEIKKGQI